MKMFGFEVKGVQTLYCKCPSCGKQAHLVFVPEPKNTPIPIQKEVYDELKKAGMHDVTTIAGYLDLHFVCMNCIKVLKYCEETKQGCLLGDSLKEMLKDELTLKEKH